MLFVHSYKTNFLASLFFKSGMIFILNIKTALQTNDSKKTEIIYI